MVLKKSAAAAALFFFDRPYLVLAVKKSDLSRKSKAQCGFSVLKQKVVKKLYLAVKML